ncbi:CaiB/BaiF CoA transferase family protein [Thermanaeromonas sp. C210]|uniref:CaiB/BaiF CoA transferase family protein n=1 Tax=Thermanaeromonas sp. C210 TaxID=2731925 RepID=UPI00155D176B|nr:CoA transferase [Thermanaeromonas sp. C210]GFN22272.1 formyl-CoA transferase [Thermanaeromonas sp. C210]
MEKALAGIKVIDLTRVLAGPLCTMILGDLGADVIKIEAPEGDESRNYGPFVKGESAYFMSINRNKRSVVLNLKDPRGVAILKKLVQEADVLVENYRPGTAAKLGISYEELAPLNPRLIYASCSGFGQTGPYRMRPAYDIIIQAMGGIMSITGQPGGEPTRVGASIGDITAALFTVIGILAALAERERSGKGQYIDISMLDCQVAILENAIARYSVGGEVPKPIGNRHPSITPFTTLRTKDGYVVIAVGNDNLWRKFCQAVKREDLIEDPRFKTNPLRTQNWDELYPILSSIFAEYTTAEALSVIEGAGVPCGPLQDVSQVFHDPQIRHREMIVPVEHPVAGPVWMAGTPFKLSRTPGAIVRPAPTLGQHTYEVLQEIGYSEAELKELEAEGVITPKKRKS